MANIEKLDSLQMSKIKGGEWVEIRKADGTIELVGFLNPLKLR